MITPKTTLDDVKEYNVMRDYLKTVKMFTRERLEAIRPSHVQQEDYIVNKDVRVISNFLEENGFNIEDLVHELMHFSEFGEPTDDVEYEVVFFTNKGKVDYYSHVNCY